MLFELPPATRDLQAVSRQLAEQSIAPHAAEVDRAETYPWDNVAALREAGLLGYTIPRDYGGAGRSQDDAIARGMKIEVSELLQDSSMRHQGGALRTTPCCITNKVTTSDTRYVRERCTTAMVVRVKWKQ